MQSGKLRHTFVIKTYVNNLNDYGEDEQTPSTFATVRGGLKNIRGEEVEFGDKVTAKSDYEIKIRYLSGLIPRMWFELTVSGSTRIFNIDNIGPDPTNAKYQIIKVTEKLD